MTFKFDLSFLLALLTLGAFTLSSSAQEKRPNILFILADDASKDSFGAYGSQSAHTPGFDSIAQNGVLFTNAYNCNPKCAPARACLLAGRYSWQLEEACNHNPFLSEKWKFYPYLLEEKGYHIGYTGKGWGPGMWKGRNASRAIHEDNPAGHPYNKRTLKPPYTGINKIDYAGNFEDFLKATPDDAPFCFWMGVKEPHRKYQLDSWKLAKRDLSKISVPAYYPDNKTIRGDLADYEIEIEWFDKHITRALEYLKASGKLKNTLIIVSSDHGMPFPRVKGQLYEDGFAVPFIARWDGKIKPGRTVTDFITFPDLAPTLLEAVNAEKEPQFTGESFLPQLLSEKSGRLDPDRNYTLLGKERHDIGRTDGELLSVSYPVRAIRTDKFLYARNLLPHRWPVGNPEFGFKNVDGGPIKSYLTALKPDSPEYRFYEMSFGKRPLEELYDIESDPDCVKNLAQDPTHRKTCDSLWTQLKKQLIAQKDPRLLGKGDIFDHYPNAGIRNQRKIYKQPHYDPVKNYEKFINREN